MKKYLILLLTVVLLVGISEVVQAKDILNYHVGAGDILSINVLGQPEMNGMVKISPDGAINFHFVHGLKVEGMTIEQIQIAVQKQLSSYIKFATVTIELSDNASQKFYVYGEVRNPGVFRLDRRVTVLKAIAMAGGYSAFANTVNIKVLRDNLESDGYEELLLDLHKTLQNSVKYPDVVLQNEDIVVISEK